MMRNCKSAAEVMIRSWLIMSSDVSYRVTEPEELVELQHTQWDTVIDKLQQRLVHDANITSV